MRFILTAIVTALLPFSALAREPVLARLQEKMDQQEREIKELVYAYNTLTYVHKLDKNGAIEKSDTFKVWQKFKGDSLIEHTLLYTSDKKGEREGKKERHGNAKLPKFDDPDYNFNVDSISGKIGFTPKKPKKGDLSGEITYDSQSLDIKEIKASMPKLKWPVSEFSMEMRLIRVEEFLFPTEFKMQAGWNALISKGRVRVESRNSDFVIYK
jgi:hypothetical protein